MVKLPDPPPAWRSLLERESGAIPLGDPEVVALLRKANERYDYWDKVRAQPLSAPYSKELVWACLKAQREVQLMSLPLEDEAGLPFRYWIPSQLAEWLHRIDRAGEELFGDGGEIKRLEARALMEEAITSSQIEGAATTLRDAKEMLEKGRAPRDESERMILNNYRTMQQLKEYPTEEMSPNLLLEIHRSVVGEEEIAGRFRRADEDVRVENHKGEVIFRPPPSSSLDRGVAMLCRFANGSTLHPVVRAIALHFYLAYLHPFVDGNGRTARALFYWQLLRAGYWYVELLSISKRIVERTGQYGRAYLYTEMDERDLTYFLHLNLRVLNEALDDAQNWMRGRDQRRYQGLVQHPELNERQASLLLELKKTPERFITIREHQSVHRVAYQTARTDLLDLVKRGHLRKEQLGRSFVFLYQTEGALRP